MNFKIPEAITWMMQQIENQQEEVFLVGGCVRDLLLHREIHDYDMTTSMPVSDMRKVFQKQNCKVLLTGIKHGTITVIYQHQAAEITTYRIESAYEHHRAPKQVYFTRNLKDDLSRRDFTINALAYHPKTGIIDNFNGCDDLQKKIIRSVGESEQRFQEDALRILRALRFRCQLHFELENTTQSALIKHTPLLTYISKERIRDEFTKLLLSNQENLLQYLKEMHVLEYILPGIEIMYDFEQHSLWHCYNVFQHTDIALNYSENAPLRVKLALVLHDIGKISSQIFKGDIAHYYGHAIKSAELAKTMLTDLKYPKQIIREVCLLIQYHDTRIHNRQGLRKLLFAMDNDVSLTEDLFTIQLCDDHAKVYNKVHEQMQTIHEMIKLLHLMDKEHDVFERKDLQVNGHDMIQLGFKKSEIKEVLEYLIKLVLKTPASNTKEKLMAFAINYKLRKNTHRPDDQKNDHKD